jgi:hypothetical protein
MEYKCTCDSRDLFNYGCKCGYKNIKLAKDYGVSKDKITQLFMLEYKMISRADFKKVMFDLYHHNDEMVERFVDAVWEKLGGLK